MERERANVPAREGSRVVETVFENASKSSTTFSKRPEIELLDPARGSSASESTVVRERSSSDLIEVEVFKGRRLMERLAMLCRSNEVGQLGQRKKLSNTPGLGSLKTDF